ncbi:MAG: hypothetical protein WAV28_16720 [Sedimentisphaerales bacterium]
MSLQRYNWCFWSKSEDILIILPYERPNDKNRVILAIKWTLKQGRENLTMVRIAISGLFLSAKKAGVVN